jgi:hypothetical protein
MDKSVCIQSVSVCAGSKVPNCECTAKRTGNVCITNTHTVRVNKIMMDQHVLYIPDICLYTACPATAAHTRCLKLKYYLYLIQVMLQWLYCSTEYGEGTGFEPQTGHSRFRISGLAVKLVIQIRSTMETYALQI